MQVEPRRESILVRDSIGENVHVPPARRERTRDLGDVLLALHVQMERILTDRPA